MRIISGQFRHRKLHSPADASVTRPIPDRVKESLFSMLRGWTEDATVLDAFAGTGAIGLEALSRGAARCVFIERDKRIAELLRRNVEELGCEDRAEVVQGDVLGAPLLSRCPKPVDLIFFDPPYPLVLDPSVEMGGEGGWERVKRQFARAIEQLNTANGGGYAVLRTPWPFRHRAVEPGTMQEAPGAGRGTGGMAAEGRERGGKRKAGRGGRDAELERAWEGEELDEMLASNAAFEEDFDHGEPDENGKPTVEVDLAIPGAIGPETHVYGHTAIHLYMKKKPE